MTVRLKHSDTAVHLRWIPRWTMVEVYLHWVHTVAFFPLVLTGMILLMPVLRPLAVGESGQFFRLVHRIFAVIFAVVPILYAVISPRRLLDTLRAIRPTRSDLAWFKGAIPFYLKGRQDAMPPQGRFCTGEKICTITLVSCTIAFSISGAVMWFGIGYVQPGLFQAMVIIHDLAYIAALLMFIAHAYISLAHPLMWGIMISMRFGVVSESYAREHHAAWYYGEERARKMYEERKAAVAAGARQQGE